MSHAGMGGNDRLVTMHVGEVSELWRFPVKSMRGDRLAATAVTERWGFPGDRGWALRDEQTGHLTNAKKLGSLLQFHARYLAEPIADGAPPVEITLPGEEKYGATTTTTSMTHCPRLLVDAFRCGRGSLPIARRMIGVAASPRPS
ncbi:MOSC N-terminal beta barrel domain-containing protein [Dietzia aerolata]|uniref:MOSC N-terminal beta barrel domain-containing protein n=1 Tax=Dietzia aerolata TaxID=595984 RepID=UPI00362AC6EC